MQAMEQTILKSIARKRIDGNSTAKKNLCLKILKQYESQIDKKEEYLQVKHHFLLWKQVVTTRHLGQTGKARGHHGAIMPAVDTLLELGTERRAFRTRSDK